MGELENSKYIEVKINVKIYEKYIKDIPLYNDLLNTFSATDVKEYIDHKYIFFHKILYDEISDDEMKKLEASNYTKESINIKIYEKYIKDIFVNYELLNTNSNTDVKKYIDYKNIFLHMILNDKISDDDIHGYIKFINFTSLPTSSYERVIKFINEDNIYKFIDLFENHDIRDILITLLPFDILFKILDHELIKPIKEIILNKFYSMLKEKDLRWCSRKNPEYKKNHYVKGYFEYINNQITNQIIPINEIIGIEKNYIEYIFICASIYQDFNILKNIINLVDIFMCINTLLRKSIKNPEILTFVLNYNDIKNGHFDERSYKYYMNEKSSMCIEFVEITEAKINYNNDEGLKEVAKWIEIFDGICDNDNDILWFTDNGTFYAKVCET